MAQIVECLRSTRRFTCDPTTHVHAANYTWRQEQLAHMSRFYGDHSLFDQLTETSIGNVLRLHAMASPPEKKTIEDWFLLWFRVAVTSECDSEPKS